jgi:DNA-directed RNA polymerase specialized sigma24 family protein
MFVDDPSSKKSLLIIVRRMNANLALREDLLQEALIHLWLTEAHRPGQTRSWYIQSCKFHLLHYLGSGRSVDSPKRKSRQLEMPTDAEDIEILLDHADREDSFFGWVSARGIISLLAPRPLPVEQAVLDYFAQGLGPREIGRQLGMSHTMVIKHRHKIAALLRSLEAQRLPRLSVAA